MNVSRILRCIKAGFAQIWSRNGIGKENDIRDSDDRSSGCGIPVRKERDYGIRALPSRAYGFYDGALYQLYLNSFTPSQQYEDILFNSKAEILWCYYSEQTSLGEILHSRLLNIFYMNIEAEPGYTDLHHTVSLQLHQLP